MRCAEEKREIKEVCHTIYFTYEIKNENFYHRCYDSLDLTTREYGVKMDPQECMISFNKYKCFEVPCAFMHLEKCFSSMILTPPT